MKTINWLSLPILLSLALIGCGGGEGNDSPSADGSTVSYNLSIQDVSATHDANSISVDIVLSSPSAETITVDYQTVDGTADTTYYVAASGTMSFTAGSTIQTLVINLQPTRDTSTTTMFHLTLSNPTNATLTDDTAVLSLLSSTENAIFNNPAYVPNWGTIGVFSSAETCASCHTGTSNIMNSAGLDVSPVTLRKHSIMAHALNDPFFTAIIEEETHIFPDKKAFIEDTCLRCHAPMAYTHAHENNLLVDGSYSLNTAMGDHHAREGISCTACHQLQNTADLGEISSMSGHFTLNNDADRDVNNNLEAFGPYDAPFGNAMQNNTQYKPTYNISEHIKQSKHCATCHNLYTPTLNLDGSFAMITNHDGNPENAQFPEQAPYWEWLNSKYPGEGKQCQTCHFSEPSPGFSTPITTRPNNAPSRTPFGQHEMVGGNEYILKLLKTYNTELGIENSTLDSSFDQKISATQAMLNSSANLEIAATSNTADTLTVPVTITNLSGHKLPTSYPSRRMWLHLTVTDTSSATVIFESGDVDSEGRIALDSNFINDYCLKIDKDELTFDYSTCYEPHRDIITAPEQVAIYETVLADVNNDITHVLLHARRFLKNNRILPIGYTNAGRHLNPVDPNFFDDDIFGVAKTDSNFTSGIDAAGSDGKDTVTYQIPISNPTAIYNIEVELLYQPVRPSYVAALHADDEITENSHVARFKQMYNEVPPVPSLIANTSATHN